MVHCVFCNTTIVSVMAILVVEQNVHTRT